MKRRAKVELFEQIRREYEFGVGTIKGVAHKYFGQLVCGGLSTARARP
jgi:hypothetical protein